MAYYITASGGTLYKVSSSGTTTALTLPTGVTLSTTRPMRWTVLGRNAYGTNGTTRSIRVDADGTVTPMILTPPTSSPGLADGGAGGYTGTVQARYSFIIKDTSTGEVIAESPMSPVSAPLTVAGKFIQYTVQTSPDSAVNARRIYRTTTGPGTAYFQCVDLDGNTQLTIKDDLSDAALALIAAPTGLGAAPGMSPGTFMTLVAEWKGRLWGVGDIVPDTLLYSDANTPYGWPVANSFPLAPLGADAYGITGLLRRRDELGVAKRNMLWKITGADTTNFQPVRVREGKGCWAPDSVVVIDDVAYYLGEDAVWSWGPNGVTEISVEKAKGWFASDTYFNRALYPNAFAKYNAKYHTYELHVAAAGSSNIDRWVAYDIAHKTWWGPHLTTTCTPAWASTMLDANNLQTPVICGTNGFVYKQNQSTISDDGSAISLDIVTKAHDANTPDIMKYWGELSMLSKVQSGGSLTITPYVGDLGAAAGTPITHDLTTGRQRLPRLGTGRFAQLEFTEATAGQAAEIYGFELPVSELGRR